MNRWTSVKDGFPYPCDLVLVYFGGKSFISIDRVSVDQIDGEQFFHNEDITHWMPLPDQPTPENGYRSDLDDGEKSKAFEIIDYLKGLSDDDRRDVLSNFCGVCHDYTGNKHCYCYE